MNDDEIEEMLEKYYRMDMHYEDRRILGSMYTTPPNIVVKSFFKFYQANLGNPGLYPGTSDMERKVVKFLLKLTSGKDDFYGHIVSGGTEANIIALWAAREMGYRRILVTEDVHFSIIKAANILKLPLEKVNMDNGIMSISSLRSKIKDGDIVVATASTTPLGLIDPIEDIGKICKDYDCFLHVDAAFGGYVIPFLRELGYLNKKFGFDVEPVRSVTIDPHKMGMAPYPAGGLVTRENLFKKIEVDAPYLLNGKNDTLLGTRQSGSVAAAYASTLHFGWDGYRKVVKKCMENTEYLVKRANEENFEIFVKPLMNIANIKINDVKRVMEKMWRNGWALSSNPRYGTIRIVVMPHVTQKIIDEFLRDLKKVEKL